MNELGAGLEKEFIILLIMPPAILLILFFKICAWTPTIQLNNVSQNIRFKPLITVSAIDLMR